MRALFIIFLILTVLALIPVGVDGGWATGQSVTLGVRVGLIKLNILPKKPREPKVKKPPKPKKAAAAGGEPAKKKKTPLDGIDKKGKLELVKAVLRALGRFRAKLGVQYLRFHYTVATPDPFKTAMGFGIASGAASAFVPLLDNAFDIEERDVAPAFDFTQSKPRVDLWITASILFWQLLFIAAVLGVDYLKIKKQHSSEPDKKPQPEKRKD